ncbi:MAG: thioredoxin domain-containing protein [Bacteroidia bacterium]
MTNSKQPNALIHETSPYLLQHAYNPVRWMAWNEQSLQIARQSKKPILVSIGYSACHWCHVMEHESFEDHEVAEIMNENFICIKVDREERPDIDHVFMNAAQLITGRGGWPLNCFAFPDGRPFYAGTYFPKQNWIRLLQTILKEYRENNEKLEQYAQNLERGIKETNRIEGKLGFEASESNMKQVVENAVNNWRNSFDKVHGGHQGAPKFPMPNSLLFLAMYSYISKQNDIEEHVNITLQKMARGGLYDQIGGGFARYSVDALWKIPHFEKMLYDNGQLLELYAEWYKSVKSIEYHKVIFQTVDFLKEELTDDKGAFLSALDADSEGEEGKYYVWKKDEFGQVVSENTGVLQEYFGINERGYWEENKYVLMRDSDSMILKKFMLSENDLHQIVESAIKKLINHRNKKIKPSLDDKVLTGWNALTISGLCKCYEATNNSEYLKMATNAAHFMANIQQKADGGLWRNYKAEKSTIDAFLEDYALLAKAFLDLFETTANLIWVEKARNLVSFCIQHFYNAESGFFNFTRRGKNELVADTVEVFDSVIPSSNAIMCHNLIRLGRLYGNTRYLEMADSMLEKMAPRIAQYPAGYSQWMINILWQHYPSFEVVVVGENAFKMIQQLKQNYLPNCLFAASLKGEGLPIFEHRFVSQKTLFYVCQNNVCQAPVETIAEVLHLVKA